MRPAAITIRSERPESVRLGLGQGSARAGRGQLSPGRYSGMPVDNRASDSQSAVTVTVTVPLAAVPLLPGPASHGASDSYLVSV